MIAALIALLLDPVVLDPRGLRVRRGLSVAFVYLTFAAALVVAIVAHRDRRRHPDEDGGRSASTTISPSRTDGAT